ncbi:hypothetical protein EV356DRAFT_478317 [Viridothelium virens]|uniref:5-Methylcytosine G/T mismatch-specific DNA glycosylase n=1 Tax=Viridothelium virens TaxID=1048519 RepID=A0A6A6HM42_VIRVR|nr:hypothetical protein EV356DRAFT_478317 [Viridothelium virens]
MPTRSDGRRRKKDRERDRDEKRSSKDKHTHSSRSRRRTSSPRQSSYESLERSKAAPLDRQSTSTPPPKMAVPELERRASTASPGNSRSGITPYPTFSKAHSKESIGPREINPRLSLYTPEHTDVGQDGSGGERSASPKNVGVAANAPPSPPLTNPDGEVTRQSSGASMRKAAETAKAEMETGRRSMESGARSMNSRQFTASQSSLRTATDVNGKSQTSGSGRSTNSTFGRIDQGRSVSGPSTHTSYRSASDSDRTSIAPEQPSISHRVPQVTSERGPDAEALDVDSPSTPTARSQIFSPKLVPDATAPRFVTATGLTRNTTPGYDPSSIPVQSTSVPPPPVTSEPPPPPPPPPPPVVSPGDVPRVDYLLPRGGLRHLVPKNLLAAIGPQQPVRSYHHYNSPKPYVQPQLDLFTPFFKLLDDYMNVIQTHGSVAVATGYRSVARRLLDRLEEVFQRNISSETCNCIVCEQNPQSSTLSIEEDTEISWGEILELVSGRRELPQWPPFTIHPDSKGLGISVDEQKPPMQILDIDVPEEFREHFIKQSIKTKNAVQNWLASQPEAPSSPPTEVDDETLIFAMFTRLEPEERRVFVALMRGTHVLSKSRTPTPLNTGGPQSELMAKSSLALTRLYRLARPPRDPETAVFLLNNPQMHDVLATVAAISLQEWEILTSGRFNGFLWSGAETFSGPGTINSPAISRGPSRGPTPASRTTTPFSTGNGPSRGTTPFHDPNPYPQNMPSRGPTPASAKSANFPAGVPISSGTPGFGPPRSATSTPAPGAPIGYDEDVEKTVLGEVERNIYQDMEALENAFEALHCRAELVRRCFRERSAALSVQAQLRRGSAAEGVEVRMSTPASAGWESETDSLWGVDDQRSELAPDDSASNISFNRRRAPGRKKERRTPALREEDEGSATEI